MEPLSAFGREYCFDPPVDRRPVVLAGAISKETSV